MKIRGVIAGLLLLASVSETLQTARAQGSTFSDSAMMQSYRERADEARRTSTWPGDLGFTPDQLKSTIMVSYGILGNNRQAWLTVEQWLSMVDATGKVSQAEGLHWDNDPALFGLRVKISGSPSFQIAFRLDFGETFLEEVDGTPGRVPAAEAVLYHLADFDAEAALRSASDRGGTPKPAPGLQSGSAGVKPAEPDAQVNPRSVKTTQIRPVFPAFKDIQGVYRTGSDATCEGPTEALMKVEGSFVETIQASCKMEEPIPLGDEMLASLMKCTQDRRETDAALFFRDDDRNRFILFQHGGDKPGLYARCEIAETEEETADLDNFLDRLAQAMKNFPK